MQPLRAKTTTANKSAVTAILILCSSFYGNVCVLHIDKVSTTRARYFPTGKHLI
jgi:hypothetical protein